MFLLFESREKLYCGVGWTNKEKDKTISSEKSWRKQVLYVAENIPGNEMSVLLLLLLLLLLSLYFLLTFT